MNSVSRRRFLKTAAAAGSVCPLFTIAGTKSSGRVLGANVPFNAKTQRLGDDAEVVATFQNLTNNLREVGVRLEESSYQLGRTLMLDPATEHFAGDGAVEANAFLTRDYRIPFIVPENV